MSTFLKDFQFLREFDEMKNKTQYIRIKSLDFEENEIESIEGYVTGGSISIDGSSSIRRTCTLSMTYRDNVLDLKQLRNIFSLNKKVKVEVGFRNNTKRYLEEEILWFPLGTYVIISPSITHSSDGVKINLQLKDKMCLLNGECGGTIPASVIFHEYETLDTNGMYIVQHPTIFRIIQELVNHWGKEQLGKIIISDIDERIKQVVKWTGSGSLYCFSESDKGEDRLAYIYSTNSKEAEKHTDKKVYNYGDDVGFIYTDFTYPGELICSAGESVCDVLDKIKNTLGNFEYFYDVYGNFIFQEIKNYLNTSKATTDLKTVLGDTITPVEKIGNVIYDEEYGYYVDQSKGKAVYLFNDANLVTSYTSTPQYNQVKNDFVVWGARKGITGNTFPIRFHLAIDKKPEVGNTYQCLIFEDEEDKLIKAKSAQPYETIDDFPEQGSQEVFYYNAEDNAIYRWGYDKEQKKYTYLKAGESTPITTTDWRSELYLSGAMSEPFGLDSNDYYAELSSEWPKLYDIKEGHFKEDVMGNPDAMDFFLDFIDDSAEIAEFSISNIGKRSKVVTDDKVNCVFEPDVPDIAFILAGTPDTATQREECLVKEQPYTQVENLIYNRLCIGGKYNSAYNAIRNLLYEYTSYNEMVSLQTIPIYYLDVNTRITVSDEASGIYGDYMIKSISVPLEVSGTMSITCSKALERI